MLKFKVFATAFLTMVLGTGVAVGVVANNNSHSTEVEAAAAVDGSVTTLIIKDSLGWNFRSLCLHTFTFAEGYSKTDLDKWLSLEYKTKASSDSSIKESSTKSYTSGSTYIYINAGGTSTTRTHKIPGWVTDFEIEVHNNSNAYKHGKLSATWQHSGHSSSTTTNKNSNALGKQLTLECAKHWNVASSYATYASTANKSSTVTVTKNYLNGATAVQTASTETKYQYFKYDFGTPDTIEGYLNDGKWYKENTFTNVYSQEILSGNLSLYASYSNVTYEVKEYNVFDGAVESEPFRTTEQGATYTPEQEELENYISKGIYTDATGTTLFNHTLSADTSLYHIYESKQYGYVYLSSFGDDWYSDPKNKETTSFDLYTWNSTSNTPTNGEWPGSLLTLSDLSSIGLNFDAKGGLIKIPFLLNGDVTADKFIISSSKPAQTADLTITIGAYYDVNTLFLGAVEGLAGDLELGAQAELAFDVEAAIENAGSHTYNEKEYAKSLCAVAKVDALALIERYEALESTTAFDKTTFWTNNIDNRKDGEGNVQVSGNYTGLEIITSLRTLHVDSASELRMILSNASESPVMLITIIATISAVSFAMIIVIKRRKQSSK